MADFTRAIGLLAEPQPEYFLERAQALVTDGQVDEALRGLDEGVKRLGPIVTLQLYALDLELGRKSYEAAQAALGALPQRFPETQASLSLNVHLKTALAGITNAVNQTPR